MVAAARDSDLFGGLDAFAPTDAALAARLAAIDPRAYARTRNYIDGHVTGLSPYLTHGLISVPEVIAHLRARHGVALDHKLVFELAWREYFHHLWSRLGDGIFEDRRAPPGRGYRCEVPADLRAGATGIPGIDQSVRTLYNTGYLHNHARMWVASYAVHLRKVHWRAGADWMYGHLIDGDLASNHLSWQWVAGTLTGRPYLFDAANVARYAPRWACPRSAVDRSYDALAALAQAGTDVGPDHPDAPGIEEPALLRAPPPDLLPLRRNLPDGPLALVHPWALAEAGPGRVGVIVADFHRRHPWSARRWGFVLERMGASCDTTLVGSLHDIAEALAGRELVATATLNPGYRELLAGARAQLAPAPRFFDNPREPCSSFSKFWLRVQPKAGV